MKILGIGNAIVDVICKVDDNFIAQNVLNKSTMKLIFDENELTMHEYKIVLINSDFDIKYKVDREKLHREIIRLGLFSTYEPCMYPGVNIKYNYNKIYLISKVGKY